MLPIEYVEDGIANNYGDHIELNEHLKEFPELHQAILFHEQSHTQKIFSKEDLVLDLSPSKINYKQLIFFMIRYPRTFKQFLPFYKKGNTFFYDINLMIVWGVIILGIWLTAFFTLK